MSSELASLALSDVRRSREVQSNPNLGSFSLWVTGETVMVVPHQTFGSTTRSTKNLSFPIFLFIVYQKDRLHNPFSQNYLAFFPETYEVGSGKIEKRSANSGAK